MPRKRADRILARRTSGSSNNEKNRLRDTSPGTSVIPTTSDSRSAGARIGLRLRLFGGVAPRSSLRPRDHARRLKALRLVARAEGSHELVEIAFDDAVEL